MSRWTSQLPGVDFDHAEAVFHDLAGSERSILARCSLVERFDESMFAAVLHPDGGLGLDDLVAQELADRLPGGDGVYQLRPAVRLAAWESWFPGTTQPKVPTPLRAFARDLADYCADPTLAPDRLRALLLVDAERATEEFELAFDACAENLDLAGCRNLLAVLNDGMYRPYVPEVLNDQRRSRKREVNAREIWRFAFLDSSRYLKRPALEAHLTELLTDDGPRTLRLEGSGGNGKSTLLKRFIAHSCVKDAVPCALVDLDIVDPVNATRHPFLVLLEIAHQLNAQMVGAPFEELLRDHGTYRTLLTRQPEELDPSVPASLDLPTSEVNDEEVRFRFGSVLADVAGGQPILIVLDTFEEAALRPANDAHKLISTLARLYDENPSVRLVISGRWTRAEDELADPWTRAVPRYVVGAFSADESETYLRAVRKITRAELITPIVEKAGGTPWKLAVLADVVDAYQEINVEQLTTLDPGAAWAIDRVIGRIEDPRLQWLVRYGAVPRSLGRDFAREVLVPRIRTSMAGSADDDPKDDQVPELPKRVFPTGAGPRLDDAQFAELWHALTRFAATTSWMSISPYGEDAVVFHPSVRGPMRRLVAAQRVGTLLHQDAVRYFERLAARDQAGWATWTAEALYHRFQLAGPAAERAWEEALAEAGRRGRLDWVANLAEEILSEEYLDEEEPKILPSGQAVVNEALVAAAHVERAWALAQLARQRGLSGVHGIWSMIEISLETAERAMLAPVPGVRLRLARAALLLARGEPLVAAKMLDSLARSPELGNADRHSLLMLLADAREAGGEETPASDARLEAWKVANEAPTPLAQLADTVKARAEKSLMRGAIDGAAWLAYEAAEENPDLRADRGFGRLLTRVELAAGRPETALGHARRAEYTIGEIDALTVLGRPVEAISRCTAMLGERPKPGLRAALLVRRGLAAAELLDIDRALADLVEARKVYFRLSDTEGAGATCAYTARVVMGVVGDLRDAEHHLDEADRLLLREGSRAWVDCRLLRAELRSRADTDEDPAGPAYEALQAVLRSSTDSRRRDPRWIVEVALRTLIWAPALESAAMESLLAWLPTITPESARLVALSGLADCPAKEGWRDRLIGAVTTKSGTAMPGPSTSVDLAWLGLRRAELRRVAGYPYVAVTNADEAGRLLAEGSEYGEWMRLAAVHRAVTDGTSYVGSPTRRPAFGSALLTAAYALTQVDLVFDSVPHDVAAELLTYAEFALDRATQRTSRWRFMLCDLRYRLAVHQLDREGAEHWRVHGAAVLAELGERPQPGNAVIDREANEFREEVRLEVGLAGDEVVVWSGASELLRLDEKHPLVAALAQENDRRTKSPIVRWVRRAVDDGFLLDLPMSLAVREKPADLRICADPPLAQLPLEFMTMSGRLLPGQPGVRIVYRSPATRLRGKVAGRALQEALLDAGIKPGPVDGYVGPATEKAVRRVQELHGLAVDGLAGPKTWFALRAMEINRRPAALVVQRGLAFEVAAERGYSTSGGTGLADLYAGAGWQAYALAGYDLGRVDEVMPDVRFDVLHVNASIDVSGSVPYLDFGATQMGWSADRTDSVPVSDLDQAVHQLAARGHTPLVVLDIATPPTFTSETIRQLLLRNDYAYQLLALGRVHSVLATGLVTGAPAEAAQEKLVELLVSADTPAGAIRMLHGAGAQFRTDALFTTLRPDLMPRLSPELTSR